MSPFAHCCSIAAFTIALNGALGSVALAETVTFKAELNGSHHIPPTDSKATGNADVSYDTVSRALSWTITYSGLTGDATAAHFHGPADMKTSARVAVPINGDLKSPVRGSITITEAQAADLLAGRYYINFHTAAHRAGEIRGQVTRQ
jgi:hypothetical protein